MQLEIPDIKALRILGGLEQSAVVARAQICRTYVSLAENQRLILKPEQYARILKAIDELAQERAAAVRKACASETVIQARRAAA